MEVVPLCPEILGLILLNISIQVFFIFLDRLVHRMVWYDMVWYGTLWYGTVWYGMVWYGTVRYGTVWYGLSLIHI